GTADNLNIHMGDSVAQTNATGVTIDAIEIETALIASGGADNSTITDFEADALTALTVTGSKSISVTLNDSAAVATIPLVTVDASAFTGSSLTISAVEADSGVTITTGSLALIATVGDGTNSVTATAGDDTVTTGSGADTIVTYDGEDTITAGDGANTITVGNGNATITGGEGVDTITAGTGNNTITLGDGADVATAGKGANTITNAAGNATITAGDGNNTVTNTAGNSTITLGGGTNTVNLTAGNSTVITGEGADDINITAGNNDITSGAGNDTITLGTGNDTVDAGTGTDTVDFTISSGTWTGAVSNAETVVATFAGSAKINTTGITGYTTLTVAASADTTTTTINNLATSTLNLTDDAAEAGGAGDLESVVVDAVDDAALVISLGANQNAATATASVLGALTVTDAASVTLKSTGGSFGNLLENDFEGVALDDNETTALIVDASSAYSSIATAAVSGSEGLDTLTLTASGAESDVEVDTLADATNLQTLSITASGLNSQVELGIVGAEASTTDAILTTLTVAASNGGDIDFAGSTDGELGDINTIENMTSAKISATGAGSTVTAGEISADGLEIASVELEASAGGVVDMETVADALVLNYSFDSLVLQADGSSSSLNLGGGGMAQDAGSLAATAEATITVEASDYGTIAFGTEGEVGGVDLDTVHIGIGNGATISGAETTITASGDIGNLDIDMDANSIHEGQMDITAGKILGTFSLNVGDEAAYDTEAYLLELSDDVDAEVGIKTLNIDIAQQSTNAIVVDLEATEVITVNSNALLDIDDSGEDGSTYYQGSIVLGGDADNTILVGASALLDTALPTAGAASVYGAWTLTTGGGGDTITGSEGIDTITSNDGADSVDGADGNDIITTGNGADTVGGGAGVDSIVLTESVSSADNVFFNAVVGTSSDSGDVASATLGADSGQDTITTFTAGTDTIEIRATAVNDFIHGTDTDLGEGDATVEGDTSNDYATTVGLINMDGGEADEYENDGDIFINFATPTTTITETSFEAALKYNLAGTTGTDTMTGGGLADTLQGGDGIDTLSGGGGADTFIFEATGSGNDADLITMTSTDVFNFNAMLATSASVQNSTSGGLYVSPSTSALATEGATIGIGNKVLIIKAAFSTANDTSTEIAALLANTGAWDAVDAAASKDSILIHAADDGTTMRIWAIENDSTAAVVSGEITLIGTVTAPGDTIDALGAANFVLV
ncbi:hypothetical protein OAD56_03785, partial [Gammaproteobacteria bacterium]|nr:hypothetical protein [Gammaproteobacteria bacterium]